MALSQSLPRNRITLRRYADRGTLELRQRTTFARSPMVLAHDGLTVKARVAQITESVNNNPLVNISIDGIPAGVRLSYGEMRHLCGGVIEGLASEDRTVLLENSLASWLAIFERDTGLAIRINGVDDRTEFDAAHSFHMTLEIDHGTGDRQSHIIPLLLNEASLAILLPALEKFRRKNPLVESVSLACRLCLLAKKYDLNTLKSIRPGDVIVLHRHEEDGFLVIENSLQLPVQRNGQTLVVDGPLQAINNNARPIMPQEDISKEETERSDFPSEEAEQKPGAIDDIKVTLQISAGEIAIQINKLRDLTEGSVIELPAAQAGDVELVVNGQKIGEGVLVTIGEVQAVEVTRLAVK